jgi:hypothetical protein
LQQVCCDPGFANFDGEREMTHRGCVQVAGYYNPGSISGSAM